MQSHSLINFIKCEIKIFLLARGINTICVFTQTVTRTNREFPRSERSNSDRARKEVTTRRAVSIPTLEIVAQCAMRLGVPQ